MDLLDAQREQSVRQTQMRYLDLHKSEIDLRKQRTDELIKDDMETSIITKESEPSTQEQLIRQKELVVS